MELFPASFTLSNTSTSDTVVPLPENENNEKSNNRGTFPSRNDNNAALSKTGTMSRTSSVDSGVSIPSSLVSPKPVGSTSTLGNNTVATPGLTKPGSDSMALTFSPKKAMPAHLYQIEKLDSLKIDAPLATATASIVAGDATVRSTVTESAPMASTIVPNDSYSMVSQKNVASLNSTTVDGVISGNSIYLAQPIVMPQQPVPSAPADGHLNAPVNLMPYFGDVAYAHDQALAMNMNMSMNMNMGPYYAPALRNKQPQSHHHPHHLAHHAGLEIHPYWPSHTQPDLFMVYDYGGIPPFAMHHFSHPYQQQSSHVMHPQLATRRPSQIEHHQPAQQSNNSIIFTTVSERSTLPDHMRFHRSIAYRNPSARRPSVESNSGYYGMGMPMPMGATNRKRRCNCPTVPVGLSSENHSHHQCQQQPNYPESFDPFLRRASVSTSVSQNSLVSMASTMNSVSTGQDVQISMHAGHGHLNYAGQNVTASMGLDLKGYTMKYVDEDDGDDETDAYESDTEEEDSDDYEEDDITIETRKRSRTTAEPESNSSRRKIPRTSSSSSHPHPQQREPESDFDQQPRRKGSKIVAMGSAGAPPPPPPPPRSHLFGSGSKSTGSLNRRKPPRPRNSWILYRQAKHEEVVAMSTGDIKNTEVSKIIADMWRKESNEVKQYWKAQAEKEKQEHLRKYPGYVYRPRRRNPRS